MKSPCMAGLAALAISWSMSCAHAASADQAPIAQGKYLVTIAGCNDCHTPGYFLGKPDFSRTLAGSDVGFTIPGLGAFVGRNLTPDKETGLGNWTDDQIISAFTAGIRPDGRRLAPIMPWQELSHLTSDDAHAIVAYLRSLPPVKNAVPGPFGPKDIPSTLVFTIVPGEVYAKMPAPK
jgi:mono/diheme cytochrome c family protein